jgi:hypothetical protein
MKPFSKGNSQFPGYWIAPELLAFMPGRPFFGAGWSRLADWKVQGLTQQCVVWLSAQVGFINILSIGF